MDYKERFKIEYAELKERHDKLKKIMVKYEAETLEFKPSCPPHLLGRQLEIMREYLHVLEVRAEIEGVEL